MLQKKITGLGLMAFLFSVLSSAPLLAQSKASGSLVVDGKPIAITQVYAFAEKGFFDPQKDDVTLLLCDAALPPPAVHDSFARGALVKTGLHCVEQTVNTEKQVINYKVQDSRFKIPEGGGSTEHVFESTTFDGKTIAGRSRTTSPQKTFDGMAYSYDITFSAAVEPKK